TYCWYFANKRTHTLILNVGVFALLQRCLERLKNGRQKFVDRFRRNSSSDESLVVKEVMDEEWMRLSEENLELPQWRPRRETSTPFSGADYNATEDYSLDEVLTIMDEIQKELMEEERSILAHEQYEDNLKFEEASLCAAIECLRTDEVLCPVCKSKPLHQNKQVIFCACGLRIDTEYDAVNLSYVRGQIESALVAHRDEHCLAEPEFCISFVQELGVRNLVLLCKSYQSISLSLSIHSSLTGREPVCERHTWTAVVGTGLVVEFFQPLQLAGVVLGYC
ncbi:PREDICTED: RPA-interacting protein A-like, partial [Acropora digitifera]|uniref:RPA-interacting protein A-like n=1 Tax=Acropora digitifera TaxID=70779 RepID=UPI00077A3327